RLDPSIEDVTVDDKTGDKMFKLHDATLFTLLGPDNKEVASTKYYDPTGSPVDTYDPSFEPLGPALVIQLDDPLLPASTYTVKITGAGLKDYKGQSIAEDANGALKPEYKFTTEGLMAVASTPDITDTDEPAKITPDAVLQVAFSGAVDEASIVVTVT